MEHNQIGFRNGDKPHVFGPAGSIATGMTVRGGSTPLVVVAVECRSCAHGKRQDIGWLEPVEHPSVKHGPVKHWGGDAA